MTADKSTPATGQERTDSKEQLANDLGDVAEDVTVLSERVQRALRDERRPLTDADLEVLWEASDELDRLCRSLAHHTESPEVAPE